jgi:neutral amino acid transport system ATP-binding protein
VLFVEHDMHVVSFISDWVVVMAEGSIVAEGTAGNVMKNPAVVDAYLGAHHDVDLGDDSLLAEESADDDEKKLEKLEAAVSAGKPRKQNSQSRKPGNAGSGKAN